jgi:hypothetical protein
VKIAAFVAAEKMEARKLLRWCLSYQRELCWLKRKRRTLFRLFKIYESDNQRISAIRRVCTKAKFVLL